MKPEHKLLQLETDLHIAHAPRLVGLCQQVRALQSDRMAGWPEPTGLITAGSHWSLREHVVRFPGYHGATPSVASRPLPLQGGAGSPDGGRRWKQAPTRISAPALFVLKGECVRKDRRGTGFGTDTKISATLFSFVPPPFPAREGVRGGSNPVLSIPRFGGRALAPRILGGKHGRNRSASCAARRRPFHPAGRTARSARSHRPG